jgi:ubiquitin-conjugating enzyme E2 A
VILGPDDTDWEGGVFHLSIVFTEEYPNKAPKVTFLHPKMFHPNIYANGDICLDILQKGWTVHYEPQKIMQSIMVSALSV